MTTRARAAAADEGVRVTQAVADQVEATLTAAMLDEGGAQAVRSGLLVAALAAPGSTPWTSRPRSPLPDALGFARQPARGRAAAAARPARRTRHRRGDATARAAAAEEALGAAESAVTEATAAHDEAQAAVLDLEARALQLQAEMDELRGKIAELEAASEETDEELAEAEDARTEAEERRRRGHQGRRDAGGQALGEAEAAALELGPALRALDGVGPAGVARRRPLARSAVGLEAAVQGPGVAQVVGGVPDAGAEAGEERGAEGGGLDDLRPLDGYADLVGLDLAEQVVGGRAAVDAQRTSAEARRHRVEHVADLEGDRLERGADDVRAGGAAGEADDQAARVRVPVRGARGRSAPGTKTTPSVSSTVAAMASVSAAEPTICRPSRSHCTAAPVTKIAPSLA